MTVRHPRINIDPNIMSGQPVISGTRVPVSILLILVADGVPIPEILENYPSITEDDIRAAFRFSAAMMRRTFDDRAAA
ncbi:DUF433 domain-containing protein [Brevundimonas aurifodinae]|uniref:DUF433 domain-containing protein n=2 Tax=Brevundimonas TaxID=41275 RepID=A0ABV1NRP2_9CAUL|nr:MAG: hypothetical protein B7Z42_07720 [Brevundimonas sp. 12-68-7]OYX33722.1 MAG: hypothetical protein B7Z01_08190 [Brevundimonas subvibrioides]